MNTALLLDFKRELTETEIKAIFAMIEPDNMQIKEYDPEWGGVCVYQP